MFAYKTVRSIAREVKMMKKMVLFCIVASALILSVVSCASSAPTDTPVAAEASAGVLAARDAAIAYVREHFEDAPAESLAWLEERATPEDVVGGVTWQYTAGDWVVTVFYAVLPPEWTVYRVSVSNEATGFQWEGRVDTSWRVPEAPEHALAARDAALRYVSEQYGQRGLGSGLAWEEEPLTPVDLPGGGSFQYTAVDWVVTVSYAVVPPEQAVYPVTVVNQAAAFRWEGEVDGQGRVTELGAEEPEVMFDRVAARDAALSYVYENYQYPPVEASAWVEERMTPEGLVGSETFRYTAFNWVVEVSYPIVAPEAMIYEVTVTNADLGLDWRGTVDAQGTVTEQAAPTGELPVVCWYGRVVLSEGSQFSDYLALEPEGAGEIGVEGADAGVEAEIEALRDKEEPGDHAHFWGTLTCDTLDYGGCQLLVTRLRPEGPEGPFFDPDPVEGWEGTLVGNPAGSQFDDYFVLAGDFPVGFGIDTSDPGIAEQLQSLRDTQTTIRVWGQVTCPAIDAFGTHIMVTRIEV
ncbi:MAG: hypothetical protein CEE40_08945 [Chloroflexi bacterium B3_Chlor]|nr:MAG: hypothetical protein CEE40_08945 [Chloroflexi bacterium B3_Chlor]